MDALRHLARERAIVAELTGIVGAQPGELTDRVAAMVSRLKDAERELEKTRKQAVLAAAGSLTDSAKDVGGVRFVGHDAGGDAGADDVRAMVLDARHRLGDAAPTVVAVTGGAKGRPVVVIATNQAARDKGIKAGELVRIAAQTLGGGGGGKDDIAQGGGQDLTRTADAINAVEWRVGELAG
jgi:alanyl-tRNA synthetase